MTEPAALLALLLGLDPGEGVVVDAVLVHVALVGVLLPQPIVDT